MYEATSPLISALCWLAILFSPLKEKKRYFLNALNKFGKVFLKNSINVIIKRKSHSYSPLDR